MDSRLTQRLVRTFVFGPRRWLLGFVLWLVLFPLLLLGVVALFAHDARKELRDAAEQNIERLDGVDAKVASALARLNREVTAAPCSSEFLRQLRRVAFEPDGLNEFLYAPGAAVLCSASTGEFETPVELGTPDIAGNAAPGSIQWVSRSLDDLGLKGVRAAIAYAAPFGIVIPPLSLARGPPWLHQELVLKAPDGRTWHLAGEQGRYLSAAPWSYRTTSCSASGQYCVAVEASLSELLGAFRNELLAGTLLAGLLAASLAAWVRAAILKHWTLEARFRRHFDHQSLVCTYQPILDLHKNAITGCEVLARWRDVDGTILNPDGFIPIVERTGMTRKFTQVLARKAFAEMREHIPRNARLQVSFNVFPCDFDAAFLCEAFADFAPLRGRFELVMEIVESENLPLEKARSEIEALQKAGIKTYIDDFGAGYSNLQNLASFAVDGVKLDRSFAMAPPDSVMAKILVHALGMIHLTTTHAILVEGVEDEERLALLKGTGEVDFVQGFIIAQPLPIRQFVRLLAERREPRASAAFTAVEEPAQRIAG